jgi:hypothetical protein
MIVRTRSICKERRSSECNTVTLAAPCHPCYIDPFDHPFNPYFKYKLGCNTQIPSLRIFQMIFPDSVGAQPRGGDDASFQQLGSFRSPPLSHLLYYYLPAFYLLSTRYHHIRHKFGPRGGSSKTKSKKRKAIDTGHRPLGSL